MDSWWKDSQFCQNEYGLSGIYPWEYHILFFLFTVHQLLALEGNKPLAPCTISESGLMTVLNMPCNKSLFSTINIKFRERYQIFFQFIFSALWSIKNLKLLGWVQCYFNVTIPLCHNALLTVNHVKMLFKASGWTTSLKILSLNIYLRWLFRSLICSLNKSPLSTKITT